MRLLDFTKAYAICRYCKGHSERRCKILQDYPAESQFLVDRGFLVFKGVPPHVIHSFCAIRPLASGKAFMRQLLGDYS